MKKLVFWLVLAVLLSSWAPSNQEIQDSVEQTLTAIVPPTAEEADFPPVPDTAIPVVDTATPAGSSRTCADVNGTELLTEPWHLEGENSGAELYQEIDPQVLADKTTLLINYNLHGLTVREGDRKDESAIIFDQPNWFVISLANYGQNGLDGEQTIEVPLSDFVGLPDEPSGTPGGTTLDLAQSVGTLHARFWNGGSFVIDISSICAFKE